MLSGWQVSAEIARALRTRALSVISEMLGTGRRIIFEAVFDIFLSLFPYATDRLRWYKIPQYVRKGSMILRYRLSSSLGSRLNERSLRSTCNLW